MKSLLLVSLLALSFPLLAADDAKDGWISLFNGKDINDWKASDEPGTFSVADGEIVVHGQRSHLFYLGPVHNHDFTNFELKCDILTKPHANSGVYFHTEFQDKGWPDKGFEVQVNNSHKDPKRTAGLYDVKDNYEVPSPDDVWFTMYIKVEGKHVITKVNDKVITDWTQPDDYTSPKGHGHRIIDHGTFALQGHDPGSETHFKNILVHPLP
jgi:hypothetical protein